MDEQNETKAEETAAEQLARVVERLGGAVDAVREREQKETFSALERFAEALEGQRSRTAPIPPKQEQEQSREQKPESRGDTVTARHARVIGDATAPLYQRAERRHQRDQEQREEFRAARNPKMDSLTKRWAEATANGDTGTRIRVAAELNDVYLDQLGYGRHERAILLEGAPNADSGFADGTGAELLPLPLANQLIVERDAASVMRGLVNVFPMATQTQRIPVMPTATADTRAENAEYSDTTPNPDSALLSATDLGVSFSAGRNFLEDSAFNVAEQLTRVAGQAIGAAEDVQICQSAGAGADITEGLDGATITTVAETTAATVGYVDIVALYYAVPKQYRRGAAFFGKGATLQELSQLLDGLGRPIFIEGWAAPRAITDGDPAAVGYILGHPVYEVPVTTTGVLYFGDPMWYALGNRAGIRVDVDRAVSTGARTWVIDERIDGRVIPTSAVNTNNSWRKLNWAT